MHSGSYTNRIKNPSVIILKGKRKSRFDHYYLPAFIGKYKFPYKLRINICNEDYTIDNIEAISQILCSLIQKYSIEGENIITGFKYFILLKQNIDDVRKKNDFLKAIKQNQKLKAQKIFNSITDQETRGIYQDYFSPLYDKSNIDEKIAEQEKCLNSYSRMVGQAQFTLYLDVINFNTDIDDYKNSVSTSPAPYINRFSHPIKLLQFLRELETELSRLRVRPGTITETDSKVSHYISFRQEQLNSETKYVSNSSDKASLTTLKKAQEDFVLFNFMKGCIKHPDNYKEIWKNGGDNTVDKMVAILNDYTKGNNLSSKLSLFLCGHVFFGMGRHHIDDVRSLVKKIKDEKLDVNQILQELNDLMQKKRSCKNKFNYAGSLFRRACFINEMCIDHVKKSELINESRGRLI